MTMMIARWLGLAAASTVLVNSALAQDEADQRWNQAIARCEQTGSPTLRIACLEATLAEAYVLSSMLDASAAGPASSALDGGPHSAEITLSAESTSNPVPTARAGDRSQSTPLDTASDKGPDKAPADGMGAEQVAARDARSSPPKEEIRMLARVERITVVPYRRLEVQLDNGQIWRQIQGDSQRIDVRNTEDLSVDIWESRMGGYQMQLHQLGRTIRVERLQ